MIDTTTNTVPRIAEEEAMWAFDEMLDEIYEPVTIASSQFYASEILKNCDPIAYRVAFAEYVDNLAIDGTEVEGWA